MRKSRALVFLGVSLLVFILFQNATTDPAGYVIHISPTGNDKFSGTVSDPVKTLSRALALTKYSRSLKDGPVTILFDSGEYYGQQVTWDSFSQVYETRFQPTSGQLGSVILDGRLSPADSLGSSSFLISFKLPNTAMAGQNTNVVISKLTVRYYFEVFNFAGINRNDPKVSINNNQILDSYFYRCGNKWAKLIKDGEAQVAMAGIRLVNSQNNKFIHNTFEDINNSNYINQMPDPKSTGGFGSALHAFYVSHNSSGNIFEGNTFLNHNSGSVIKIRDQSHSNVIQRNRFDNVSRPIQIWHCEAEEPITNRLRGLSLTYDLPETENIDESNNSVGCSKSPYKNESYECLSYDNKALNNLYQHDSLGNYFSQVNSPFWIFSNNSYACRPNRVDSSIISDGVVNNQGVLQMTTINSVKYFGICGAENDCVNSKNSCFANMSGSAHSLCSNNDWKSCSYDLVDSSAGDISKLVESNQFSSKRMACLLSADRTDASWTLLASGQYLIASYMSNRWNFNICSGVDSCVNSNGSCWQNNTGSSHMWCVNTKWQVCNSTKVGVKANLNDMNSKTCIKVSVNNVVDYVWK